MAQTLLIVNQTAAKARRLYPVVRDRLLEVGTAFDIHETTHAGNATEIVRAALKTGHETIVVLGGDGTLSEAAQGFFEFDEDSEITPRPINREAVLAVIPAGTGDDFARGLRGTRTPLNDWTSRLIAHLKSEAQRSVRTVDLLYGRCDGYKNRFICLNASTLGIGGDTGARVAGHGRLMRQLSGEGRFLLAAAGAVAAWRERRVVVSVDDQLLADGPMNLVAVANNVYAGAGMMLSPEAKIEDGKLDVVIASGLTRVHVIRELSRVHTGGHVANPKVKIRQGRYVRIETFSERDALRIEADGNVRGFTPADYRIMPGAIRFVG